MRTFCLVCTLTTAGVTFSSIGASEGIGCPSTAAGSAPAAIGTAGAGSAQRRRFQAVAHRGRGESAETGGDRQRGERLEGGMAHEFIVPGASESAM